jgi:ABC-type multidrug transport system fused ATPase/permease subunit
MRIISETFKGYTEIQLNHAFPLFHKRFEEGLQKISLYREETDRVMRIPSGMIECYVAAGLFLAVLLGRGSAVTQLTFGIIAIAVLRMLPAVRTLVTGWAQLRNASYAVETIQEALNLAQTTDCPDNVPEDSDLPLQFHKQIDIQNLTFSFPDQAEDEKPVIENFSLTIKKGECIGIQGVSGAGKSTLFNLLLGFYSPLRGEIRIDGTLLDASTRAGWHAIVGYVPQDVFIMDGSLAENIALGQETIDYERLENVLENVKLKEFATALPENVHTRIGENGCRLSGGQRQRVGIARALYKQAEILFFDEATSSLDSQTEKEVTAAINDLSTVCRELTIVIIAHRDSSLAFCDRIIPL